MTYAIAPKEAERRQPSALNYDDLWEGLTLPQKFAASSLIKYGYELQCIRDFDNTHIAILRCNDAVAVISISGEINTHPDIKVRR